MEKFEFTLVALLHNVVAKIQEKVEARGLNLFVDRIDSGATPIVHVHNTDKDWWKCSVTILREEDGELRALFYFWERRRRQMFPPQTPRYVWGKEDWEDGADDEDSVAGLIAATIVSEYADRDFV